MNKTIIIFLQTNNNILSSDYFDFLNSRVSNCKVLLKSSNKKICFNNQNIEIKYYDDLFFNFDTIKSQLKDYDYFIYLDDNYDYSIINLSNIMTTSISILKEHNVNQVIFDKTNFNNERLRKDYVHISDYELFKRINKSNTILLNEHTNSIKSPHKIVDFDETNFTTFINKGNIPQYPYYNFQLLPSAIEVQPFLSNTNMSLKYNPHSIYIYSELLELNGFKSQYFMHEQSNSIMNENLQSEKLPCKLNEIKKNNTINNNTNNNNGDNTTIITAFLDLGIKRPAKRPTQEYEYIEKAKGTLSIKQNMVIYVSKNLIEHVKKIRSEFGLLEKTVIIGITVQNNLYMYDELDKIRKNVSKNVSPYNIAEYVLSVNSRYNYLKDAITNDYFGSDFYAWVDFSAGHIVDIPTNFKISYSGINKIRIAWISRIKKENDKLKFAFNHYCLGGGIFVAHREIMLELIKIHDIQFRELADVGYCINDDKLLFIIFEKYPHLFDVYHCGYKSLLTRIND
jgi:hypothetical protein